VKHLFLFLSVSRGYLTTGKRQSGSVSSFMSRLVEDTCRLRGFILNKYTRLQDRPFHYGKQP